LWVRFKLTAKCIRYNILWSSLSVTCDKSIWISLGLQFPPPIQLTGHDITEILLKVTLNAISIYIYSIL
jgi:hypothetical protein